MHTSLSSYMCWCVRISVIVGNGYIGAALDSDAGLFIRMYRALTQPVKYHPVVRLQVEGLKSRGEYGNVYDNIDKGEVHLISYHSKNEGFNNMYTHEWKIIF